MYHKFFQENFKKWWSACKDKDIETSQKTRFSNEKQQKMRSKYATFFIKLKIPLELWKTLQFRVTKTFAGDCI